MPCVAVAGGWLTNGLCCVSRARALVAAAAPACVINVVILGLSSVLVVVHGHQAHKHIFHIVISSILCLGLRLFALLLCRG